MFTFLVNLLAQKPKAEKFDPRGGRLMNLDQSADFNNQHHQRQILPANAAQIAPDGQPNGYLWMLPYAGNDSETRALIRALNANSAKTAPGGHTAQVMYSGLQMGLTKDG